MKGFVGEFMSSHVPVITLDGPSGSGKGTLSVRLAKELGWNYLDSGALYRAIAWILLQKEVGIDDATAVACVLERVDIKQDYSLLTGKVTVWCNGQDISDAIRDEAVGVMASKISALSEVRNKLLNLQRICRVPDGLLADGRDMGTVVFPDAVIKFYLEASTEVRAQRRFKQLKEQGINVNLSEVRYELQKRDERDASRELSPAKPAPDVIMIDTSLLAIDEVFDLLMSYLGDLI